MNTSVHDGDTCERFDHCQSHHVDESCSYDVGQFACHSCNHVFGDSGELNDNCCPFCGAFQ